MPKLKRYTNFEDLKAADNAAGTVSGKPNKRMPEFEQFLTLLRSKLSARKKNVSLLWRRYAAQ